MSEERKKIVLKPIGVITPKKRVENKVVPIKKDDTVKDNPEVIKDVVETTKSTLKFVKVYDGTKQEQRKEIGDRVMKGELKWHHYIFDGDKGCHNYLILKK